jgi:hypothetical protein
MKKFKEISEEKATPEERAKLSLKHAQEKEKLVQTHKAEKERLSQQEEVGTRQSGPITLSKERKAKLVKVFDSLKVGDTVKIKFKRGGFEKQIPIRKKEILRTRNRGWTRITFGDGVYLYKDPKEGRVVYAHGRMPSEVMDMIKESLDEAGFSDAQLQKMKKSYSTIKRIDPSSQNYKKLKTKISELDVDRLEQIARAKIRFVSMIAAGEYAKKSGKRLHARDYMESTELEETVQINEVQQKEVDALKKLSKDMQAVLKGYQKIVVMGDKELKDTKYNKDYEAVLKSRDTILSLIGKVNFKKAQIELKNMKESLEENVKISFHSKGAKTKWMKKQAVASKEIIKQTPTSVELPSRWKDLSKKKDHDEIFSVVVERKLTDAEMDKREKVAKAIEKDSPDMPMGKKMAIATNVAKGVKMENDEYDNEGGMALSQLRTAKSAVEDLMASIQEMDNLPEWVQSKLTKAVDYMDSVRDYMASEEGKEPVDEASAYADARRAFKRDDKRGLASLKRDTDDSATDSDKKAANKNIIMQLRKAADLPNGAEVIFPSGKKKVDRRTAQQMLVKFNSLKKSFEKDKFQKSIKSLADVKKILGR